MREEEADRLAKAFRKLAETLEKHPEKLDFLLEERTIQSPKPRELFDPFKILNEEGEEGLKKRIDRMSVAQLKRLIQENRLDSSGLSNKWRDRKRLADLALQRLRNRHVHGDVFSESSKVRTDTEESKDAAKP